MEATTNIILIVEDDNGLVELLSEKIGACGYLTSCVGSAGKAIDWIEKNKPFMMILDYSLPDLNGKEFINQLITNGTVPPPFIVSTGQGDERIAVEMMKLGARDYIIKDNHFLEMIPIVIAKVSREIENETRLKAAEQALIESNQFNNQIIHSAHEGIIVYDHDLRFKLWNPFMEKLTGLSSAEIIGKHASEIFPFLKEYGAINAIEKALKGESSPEIYLPFNIAASGKSGWASDSTAPLYNTQGKIIGAITTVRDITQRKQDEEQLRERENNYTGLFNTVKQAIYIQNPDLTFINVNQGAIEMYGYEREFFIGKTPEFLSAPGKNDLNQVAEFVNLAYHGQPQKYEFWGLKKDGGVFPKEVWTVKGRYYGKDVLITLATDITDRKQAEHDLLKAKEHAEESDRLKSAFLANMSHEIRTPMNGILGFAELLKKPNLSDEKQQMYISIIEKSGARMLNIINDIVDISKIESGLMKISITETNINEQIEFIYSFFKPEAEQKKLILTYKNGLQNEKAIIKTDREKIYAILTNIIKNAIKYSDSGSIEFGYNLKLKELGKQENSSTHEVEFYVKDTGIGIPRDRQEAIFERFIQADITDKRAYQGAGLGLAISKAYLEMLGGKIWVESQPGKGSTFYFTLPYEQSASLPYLTWNSSFDENKRDNFRKLKILIAEDDETSVMLLSEWIDLYCDEILIAKTGVEAVEICQANQDIDLVLMDIQMPEMDGYEATSQIRKFNKELIIVAQTAYAISGEKEKAKQAGCSDYISKPIKYSLLVELIKKYFEK